MKKKLLAMFLVLSLACVQFVGCRSDKKEDSDKNTEATADKEDKSSEEEKKTEEKEEKKITPERGAVENNVYTNKSFGISFPIASNMIVCTDEQIAQTLSLGQDVLSEETKYTVEDIEKATKGSLYDAMCLFSDNSSSVAVIYEDLDKSQSIALDEEQYIKALANNLKSMSMYEVGEASKQNIGGTDFSTLTVEATLQGVTQTQKYFLHQVGNYMIEFIFTYTDSSKQEVEDFMSTITFESPL